MRTRASVVATALALPALCAAPAWASSEAAVLHGPALQAGRQSRQEPPGGPEQTERFTRTVPIGSNGRVAIENMAGDVTVRGGSGSDVTIEAVKRTRGDRSELANVEIEVNERAGRVTVETVNGSTRNRGRRSVRVDYTITVPSSAEVDVETISGNIRLTDVRGAVRAESVSGSVTISGSPGVEEATSVSGDVDVSGVDVDRSFTATSMNGQVRVRGVKARAVELGSVSGTVDASEVACDRLEMKSLSGNLLFSGRLAPDGRYAVSTHSGDIRLALAGETGFEVSANTFSGSVDSGIALTRRDAAGPGADRRRGRALRGTFGNGSAVLDVRTFSGNIQIDRQ